MTNVPEGSTTVDVLMTEEFRALDSMPQWLREEIANTGFNLHVQQALKIYRRLKRSGRSEELIKSIMVDWIARSSQKIHNDCYSRAKLIAILRKAEQ